MKLCARLPLAAMVGLMLTGLATTASGSSIVVNGSFEDPDIGGTFQTVPPSIGPTNWTVGAGSVDFINNYWQAVDGQQSLDMSGLVPGTIAQTLATVVGQTYILTFAISGNPDNVRGLKTVEVLVGSAGTVSLGTFVYDTATMNNTHQNMKWDTRSVMFTATSTSEMLTFKSLTGTAYGPAIDAVSVVPVPLPAAVWSGMSMLSALGVGAAIRKKLRRA